MTQVETYTLKRTAIEAAKTGQVVVFFRETGLFGVTTLPVAQRLVVEGRAEIVY